MFNVVCVLHQVQEASANAAAAQLLAEEAEAVQHANSKKAKKDRQKAKRQQQQSAVQAVQNRTAQSVGQGKPSEPEDAIGGYAVKGLAGSRFMHV